MPDPISPSGSPGQLSQVTQTQASFMPVPTSNSEVGRAASPERNVAQNLESVDLEVANLPQARLNEKRSQENTTMPSLEEAVKDFREFLKNIPADLQFKKDDETGTVMFKVINPVTKEVLREFPPEEVVAMSKRLRKMEQQIQKSGVFFDAKS